VPLILPTGLYVCFMSGTVRPLAVNCSFLVRDNSPSHSDNMLSATLSLRLSLRNVVLFLSSVNSFLAFTVYIKL